MNEEKLRKIISDYYDQSIKSSGVFFTNSQSAKKDYLNSIISNSMGKELLELVKKYVKTDDKILDDGCGLGGFLVGAQSENFKVIGIDIDQKAVNIAKTRIKDPDNIILASGENLPFSDQTFNLVVSQFVIEHIKNPKKYLSEIERVLKPNGKLILYAPNNLFPWEGHYHMFWLPYLIPYTKKIIKWYLKRRGRKTDFLDFVNLKITPGYLKKLFKQNNLKKIDDLSIERFKKIINEPGRLNYPKIKKILEKLKDNSFTNYLLNLFLYFLKITKLYHPIILVYQK